MRLLLYTVLLCHCTLQLSTVCLYLTGELTRIDPLRTSRPVASVCKIMKQSINSKGLPWNPFSGPRKRWSFWNKPWKEKQKEKRRKGGRNEAKNPSVMATVQEEEEEHEAGNRTLGTGLPFHKNCFSRRISTHFRTPPTCASTGKNPHAHWIRTRSMVKLITHQRVLQVTRLLEVSNEDRGR